jgi:ribose transport system permease protein
MRRELGMLVALVLMCVGLWASNHDFLGPSNVINTARQVSMLGIFAIGIAFVIITGGIDLSVGSVIGLTGVLIAKFCNSEPGCYAWPLWAGIAAALAVAVLIGLGQGLLITRLGLQPFIVTLGGMLFLRGLSQTIVRGGTLSVSSIQVGDFYFRDLSDSGLLYWHGDPLIGYPVLIFLAAILIGGYLLHFTVFGRYVYAIGGNRDAAEYSGIPVKRIETLAYVISAALAGVAGVCYAAYIGQMSQNVGIAYELYAIAGAVLGGCSLRGGEGTVLGVVIGSAIMKVIENGIIMFQIRFKTWTWRLNDNWKFIIIGAVILIAVILDQIVHIVQDRRRTRSAGEVGSRV